MHPAASGDGRADHGLAARAERAAGGPGLPDGPWRHTQPRCRRAIGDASYEDRAAHCASLTRKHVSPHVLRHTAAMELLAHGVDRAVIALWLGHESVETTQMYLHADMRLKEQALARTTPADVTPGRYRPTDRLLAFLEGL